MEMIVSSFSWDVNVMQPNIWYTSERFFFLNQYTTAFWLQVNLDDNALVNLRVYKDCPVSAKAVIRMVVNGAFNCPEIIYDWTNYCELLRIPIQIDLCNMNGSYLKKNVSVNLKITCKSIKIYSLPRDRSPPTQFDYWKQFHLNSEFSDFTVVIGDEKLPVHKFVLAAQSPVFSRMFTTDMREASENQIELKHDGADVMKEMIEYFYTGDTKARTDAAAALKILPVAHQYDVKYLIFICEWTLMKNLTVQNVCSRLDVAEKYQLAELRRQALGFLVISRKEVIETYDFQIIVSKHPSIMHEFIRLLNIECDRLQNPQIPK